MPVVPSRISGPHAVSRCHRSFLVAGTIFLLGIAALAHPARAQDSGACCTPYRACTITEQAECVSPDTWQGPGVGCAPTPCPKPPTLTEYRFLSPDTLPNGDLRPLTREDTVILLTRWEVPNSPQLMDSLRVTADFSRLDPGVSGNDAWPVQWLERGQYQVIYPLSGLVSNHDTSGIRIPLSATAPTGSTIDRRIQVCLSNHPPVHVATRIVPDSTGLRVAPYRSGDFLVIETIWRSPDNLPLQITASFAEVDTGLIARGIPEGNGVFIISYQLPLSPAAMTPDGPGKAIPITARDAGCGQTTNDNLRIATDTEPPPVDAIRIDPLPPVTAAESLLVGGEALGSRFVVIIRNNKRWREPVDADPITGRFGGMLELVPGENKIQVRGVDASGNTTTPVPGNPLGVFVTRIAAAELEIGTPYSRKDVAAESGDFILLRNPEPMDAVAVRIFNLEGDCLWEERPASTGQLLDVRFHWTGTDRAGERAPQGYYLVRAQWRGPGGKAHSITKGLLLRD
jgi:hypothetical protein